jgi:hypothetical protein
MSYPERNGSGHSEMDTLGWVVPVEDDDAVTVDFGSRKVRILSPFAKLTQALMGLRSRSRPRR